MKYTKLVSFTVIAGLLIVACSESSPYRDAKVAQAKVSPNATGSNPQKESSSDDNDIPLFTKEEWGKVLLLRSLLRESQIVFEQVWAKVEPETTGKKLSVLGELRSRIDASLSESGQDLLKKEGVTCDTEKHMVLKTSIDPVSKVKLLSFLKHSCNKTSDMDVLAQVYVLGEDLIQVRIFNAPMSKAAGRMGSFLAYKTECTIQTKEGQYLAALSCKSISQDTGPISHTLFEVMRLSAEGEVFVKGQKFENISDVKEGFELKISLEGDGVYLYETFEDEVQDMAPTFPAINEHGLESNPQQQQENKGEQNGQKEESSQEDGNKEEEQKSQQASPQGHEESQDQDQESEEEKLSEEEELQFTGA